MMQQIAVLLTVHNRKQKTLQCLQNLYTQLPIEGYGVDVYLTDDGCTDGTPEAVRVQFPQVNIINGDGGLFWNRGMYMAWKKAADTKDYDFYLWLNDDTMIYTDALRVMLKVSDEQGGKCIVVGATCAVGDRNVVTYGGRTVGNGLLNIAEDVQTCDFFNGNVVLIPKSVYHKIGMNDPYFRHALGDFDYGLRAGKSGIKSVVAPGCVGECDVHEHLPVWCNPDKLFRVRWRAFRTPLGHNPEEFFVYEKRHEGYPMACLHYLSNHLRVICPSIWK